MALFDLAKVTAEATAAPDPEPETLRDRITAAADVAQHPTDASLCREMETLAGVMPPLTQGRDIVAVSAGGWALHDLLRWTIRQTGPADFAGWTWSLTQPAANVLGKLYEDGMLRSPRFVMDFQMSKWSREALAWLARSFTCHTCGIHAKGFAVGNGEWQITVVSSANFSNNPRVECFHISTDPAVYRFSLEWFDSLLAGREPFKAQDQPELPTPHTTAEPDWRGELILLRGLPGSGKSTLAATIAASQPNAVALEADTFFVQADGTYKYQPDGAPLAHAWCLSEAQNAMAEGKNPVIVANVFATEADTRPYTTAAAASGYRLHSLVVENRHGGGNIHDVSPVAVSRMATGFQVRLKE